MWKLGRVDLETMAREEKLAVLGKAVGLVSTRCWIEVVEGKVRSVRRAKVKRSCGGRKGFGLAAMTESCVKTSLVLQRRGYWGDLWIVERRRKLAREN